MQRVRSRITRGKVEKEDQLLQRTYRPIMFKLFTAWIRPVWRKG